MVASRLAWVVGLLVPSLVGAVRWSHGNFITYSMFVSGSINQLVDTALGEEAMLPKLLSCQVSGPEKDG